MATALAIAVLFGAPTAIVYYDRRGQYTRHIRAWRHRLAAHPDQPFHPRLLTASERRHLIGRRGLTTEQWYSGVCAEYLAGRRDHMPTCGDYLAEFGTRPKVQLVDA